MRPAQISLILAVLIAFPGFRLFAQPPGASRDDLGLKLTAIPDAVYAHVPSLERGAGLLVETIKPGSRAAELGLKPFDIVLVKNGDELKTKLSTLHPGEREVLQIIRGGKPFALSVASPSAENYTPPKSLFKPDGPPAVSVEVKPLTGGNMEVNLFYLNRSNKMDRRTLQGSLEQIEQQVADLARQGHMPENIHDLVALALKRLRTKNSK